MDDLNVKENINEKIKIFSNKDKKLKSLGKALNNDSSREIFQLLIEKQMAANEIASQTKLSLPLTLRHINQMIEAGIVIICKTENNSKNQPMKYYSAKPGILILPEKASEKAKHSKSLTRSLKSIVRFSAIGICGAIAWFSASSLQVQYGYQDWGPKTNSVDQLVLPITAAAVTVGILYWLIIKKEKKGLRIYQS